MVKKFSKQIPLVDLKAEYKSIKKDLLKNIKEVFERGWYVLGPEVEEFEKKFASFIGCKFGVGVASGTDALTLAVKSLGLGKGDEVIIPANVYPTAFGVALTGVDIQLADVDSSTLNTSLKSLKDVVTKRTKAIVVVHLYGNPASLEAILKFAQMRDLLVIEDCAQATGAIYKGKRVGSFGHVSCFSFYPTKNLGAYGDGGAILTDNKEIFQKARLLRTYGEESRYNSVMLGHNSRLDEIQASILLVKIKYLEEWNKKRRVLAGAYSDLLDGLPLSKVSETEGAQSCYHLYVVRTKERDRLAAFLDQRGVKTGVHYPVTVHLTSTFGYLGYKEGNYSISEQASKEVLSLPLYPQMSIEEVEYVVSAIKDFYK